MPVFLPVGRLDAGPPGGAAPAAVSAVPAVVSTAPGTAGLTLALVVVFVGLQQGGSAAAWPEAYGLTPARYLTDGATAGGSVALVTALFAHATWLHLFYNLAALWVFGSALERVLGSARYLAFFVGLGALAMLAEALVHSTSTVPIVGASGAIAAVAGAFAVAFPKARLLVAAVFLTLPIRARLVLGLWLAGETLVLARSEAVVMGGGQATVAHLAGFALGALGMLVILRTSAVRRQGRGAVV